MTEGAEPYIHVQRVGSENVLYQHMSSLKKGSKMKETFITTFDLFVNSNFSDTIL